MRVLPVLFGAREERLTIAGFRTRGHADRRRRRAVLPVISAVRRRASRFLVAHAFSTRAERAGNEVIERSSAWAEDGDHDEDDEVGSNT